MKNTKELNLFFLIALMFFLSGCKKCDEFNDDLLNWFPYKVNDEILFSAADSMQSYKISRVDIIHTEKVGYLTMCACADFYQLEMISDSAFIYVSFDNSKSFQNSLISKGDKHFRFSEQHKTYAINRHIYSDVIVYQGTENDYSSTNEYIFISKYIGIISISEKDRNWMLVDRTERNVILGEVNYVGEKCI